MPRQETRVAVALDLWYNGCKHMQDDKKRLKLAEDPLSPEETHKIEVRVDKMMQFDPPKEEPATTETTEPEDKEVEPSADTPSAPVVEVPPTAEEATPEAAPETPPATEPEPVTPAEPAPTAPNEADDELARLAAEPNDEQATETDQVAPAVDSLAANERDAELEKRDAEIAAAFAKVDDENGHRIKRFFKAWWQNKKARWATVVVLVLLLVLAGVLPPSRAWALNLFGVRAKATLTVLDATTQLPLKNVAVRVGGSQGLTDASGHVSLAQVKLGHQTLNVTKLAFAITNRSVTINLGNNNLGSLALKAAGTQYRIKAIDYVTGAAITNAAASSGDANAEADSQGLITLTVPTSNDSQPVIVSADGYRNESIKIAAGTTAVTTVQLVTSRHEVYFSKQSGNYDLYRSDIDGKNASIILKATGNETSTLALLPHPTADEAAVVDTRDGTHNSDGYALQNLILVNVTTGASTTIDHSERIMPIDWIGDRLVYAMAKAGASAANPSRYQLMSYDYLTNERLELDHANAFNDIVSTAGSIYYATSNQYNGGASQFTRISADGTNKQILLNNEVWNILRKDYNDFYLNTGTDNYTYVLGDAKPNATTDTYNSASRLYIDSPDGKHSLWVDQRDGKGVLLSYDIAKKTDTVIASQVGLDYPVRWLTNDSVVYRVHSSSGTADYAIGLTSNTAKKITDVTDAAGRSLWYFY